MGETMKDRVNALNYTFQMFLVNINNKMQTMKQMDKYLISLWKNKLQETANTIDECTVRNEFALILSQQIDTKKVLSEPFTKRPPIESLLEHKELIANLPLPSGKTTEDISKAARKKKKNMELSDKEFLVGPNPVAKCGAFCYLAVMSRTAEEED